ncbi:MAG TPA: mechanosensitive ion channel family protein [Gammaproteobacteria bacterium]|nr:mechanosensitive ion channel family protein [Gammaproteobacteria bacterium]
MRTLLTILLLSLFLFTAPLSFADEVEAPTIKELAEKQDKEEDVIRKLSEAPKKTSLQDEYNRQTPRSSLLGLILAVKEKDYERAANYLDLRNLPFGNANKKPDGAELARMLSIVGRRAMVIDLESISDNPRGDLEDGLPSYRDRITTLNTQKGPVDILMQRVPRGDGAFIWKISNATVARIPELEKEFGYGYIGDKLSMMFPQEVVLGLELWQIIMFVGVIVASFILSYLITMLIVSLLRHSRLAKRERVRKFVVGPLRFLILVIIVRLSFDMISPSMTARAIFEARTLLILAVYWVSLSLVDLVFYRLAEHMRRNGQKDAVVLLKPAATGVKIIVATIAIISWLDNLGYEVTTIVAGLGVGGIAVALAAQKSLENLIGSIMIYASQPVRVGDFCQFGKFSGTVEEIGLRSTQLRTLARTVVHVPNALFASAEIENYTQRDKILYRTRLRLDYSVGPDKLRKVLEDIRAYIDKQDFIDEENSRVRFLEFGEYAQELELYVYIKTREFSEYLGYREEVNLDIRDIIEDAGVELIIPVRKSIVLDQSGVSTAGEG